MSMMLLWLPCIKTYILLKPLPRNVLTPFNPIAVLFALAQTPTEEIMDDLTKDISKDLTLPATDHLLLQATVKDIKAAETLDVVVEDSQHVVDVEAAVDVTAQDAPLVYTMLKMNPLLNLTTKSPKLPISIPTLKINMLRATMIPSTLEFQSTTLLQVTMKLITMKPMKAPTLGVTTRITENTEYMRLTPSDQS